MYKVVVNAKYDSRLIKAEGVLELKSKLKNEIDDLNSVYDLCFNKLAIFITHDEEVIYSNYEYICITIKSYVNEIIRIIERKKEEK